MSTARSRKRLLSAGVSVLVAEIADYEVRRALLRAGRLGELKEAIGNRPMATPAMLTAVGLWADARKQGQPAAPDPALPNVAHRLAS